MPAEIEPPELAALLDFAERPRVDDWSLRSALVRYAQPQPVRVSQILEQVRRIDWALQPHQKLLEREGPALWAAVQDGEAPSAEPQHQVVGVLQAASELDRLADELATWAVDRQGHPDEEVDRVVAHVASHLDAFGVGHEEREGPPPRRRG